MKSIVTLGRADTLAEGEARGFDPGRRGRDTLFVVRSGGALRGWLDRCPHEDETPLPYRRHAYLNAARTRIVCFAHGAQFDVATGECVSGPCLGESLTPVPLSVTTGGELLGALTSAAAAYVHPGRCA